MNTTGTEGGESFVQGLLCEMSYDDNDVSNKLVEAVHHYWDAFLDGSIEAGVNVMRILMKTQIHVPEDQRSVLANKYKIVSERLTNSGNPIMPYYEALSIITNEGKKTRDRIKWLILFLDKMI